MGGEELPIATSLQIVCFCRRGLNKFASRAAGRAAESLGWFVFLSLGPGA